MIFKENKTKEEEPSIEIEVSSLKEDTTKDDDKNIASYYKELMDLASIVIDKGFEIYSDAYNKYKACRDAKSDN